MNLKKTAFSLFAATALSLTMAAPMVSAQNADDDAYARVTLEDVGQFDAYFNEDSFNFGTAQVTAENGTTLTGRLGIVYEDTQAYRGEFTTSIRASNFNSSVPVPYNGDKSANGAGNYFIDSKNFRVVHTNNVGSMLWSGKYNDDYRVGDIGAYGPSGTQNNYTNWTPSEGTLNLARKVNYAWEGSGSIQALSLIDVELKVPAAMPGVPYQSVLTLTVSPGTP